MAHYTYILQCADNTLYTGYTTDLQRRVREHNQGTGAKYTRGRTPVKLCYSEEYSTRSQAQQREYAIKQLSRQAKLELIKEDGND
ncbi:GIY-YIG nuclease family protein [Halanaerobaculum tunisiense]